MKYLLIIFLFGCTDISQNEQELTVSMFDENKIINPDIIISRSGSRIIEAKSDFFMFQNHEI